MNETISLDQPFNYEEVAKVTGKEYVLNVNRDGISTIPYRELKTKTYYTGVIDVDMPFDEKEVAKCTGEDYTRTLSRSDMPVPELPKDYYCLTGRMDCAMYKKLGKTCKKGYRTGICPQTDK